MLWSIHIEFLRDFFTSKYFMLILKKPLFHISGNMFQNSQKLINVHFGFFVTIIPLREVTIIINPRISIICIPLKQPISTVYFSQSFVALSLVPYNDFILFCGALIEVLDQKIQFSIFKCVAFDQLQSNFQHIYTYVYMNVCTKQPLTTILYQCGPVRFAVEILWHGGRCELFITFSV